MRICINGVYRDLSDAEVDDLMQMQAEAEKNAENREPTPEERLAELEAQNQMLTQCLMEMSQIVYA